MTDRVFRRQGGQFIADASKDKPLSSWSLHLLFRGKLVNTPAFFIAALVHEKWRRTLKGKKPTANKPRKRAAV